VAKAINSTPPVFLLFDEIDSEVAKNVVEWIIKNNAEEKPHDSITLIVNSTGGGLSAAFAIIDCMNYSSIPVKTIGTGDIQSSGLMIFMSGVKGSRTIMPNTSIMSHHFCAETEGKFHDIMAIQKEYTMLHDKMIRLYMKCTSLTKKEIEKDLLCSHDVYLSLEEALAFGISDI